MAKTIANVHAAYTPVKYNGNFHEILALMTIGAADTYATGGIAVSPSDLQVGVIVAIEPVLFSNGYWGVWVPATGKIKVFSAAGTELANASAALQSQTAVIRGQGLGL